MTPFKGRLLTNVLIPMRDGVRLSAHIALPITEEKVPAILLYTPYHKGMPNPNDFFVQNGYALVYYDVRGTGDSEGVSPDMYADEERRDGYEVVEWLARQPWCNGNVGMWGISYCGVVCWQVAVQNPPHLKAIIVRAGTDDVYGDWVNPGGSPRPYVYENYATQMTAYNFAPPNIALCGERWAEIWRQHLDGNIPWGIGFITNLQDGPYWLARSAYPDYDRIKCAAFLIDGWADWYPSALLRAFSRLKAPKKILIGPWDHRWPADAVPGPRIDHNRECKKWFDQWLKGIDTGVLDEPPVTIFVREYSKPEPVRVEEKGAFRDELDWPIPRARNTSFYLHPDGNLTNKTPQSPRREKDDLEYDPAVGFSAGRHAGGPFHPWGMPTDQRPDEIYSLVYTTEPARKDVEITGHPKARLFVSSTADIAFFSVKLCDVAPDGTSAMITKGYLNAAQREGRTKPSLLEPGKVYELEFDLLACAYRLPRGHRIRIDIAGADFPNAWPTPKSAVHSVYRCREFPSRVILPIIPAQDPPLPPPDLKPSDRPLPTRDQIPKPEYTVTYDVIADLVTSYYKTKSAVSTHTASFTVSRKEPARAVVQARFEQVVTQAGIEAKVESQCTTSSDLHAFHHLVQVEITVNGKPHFSKSWTVSVPRRYQ